ncbi:hypothetical protein EAE99_005774 [Botrytis elliptica]|nr:hypothetical protein EAE99_005774 [Botrytis elliptica]
MLSYCRLLGLDPKNAKVVGSGLEDLRWYARAWNHELKLSPRSTPAHMYTPFREANGMREHTMGNLGFFHNQDQRC